MVLSVEDAEELRNRRPGIAAEVDVGTQFDLIPLPIGSRRSEAAPHLELGGSHDFRRAERTIVNPRRILAAVASEHLLLRSGLQGFSTVFIGQDDGIALREGRRPQDDIVIPGRESRGRSIRACFVNQINGLLAGVGQIHLGSPVSCIIIVVGAGDTFVIVAPQGHALNIAALQGHFQQGELVLESQVARTVRFRRGDHDTGINAVGADDDLRMGQADTEPAVLC